MGERPERDFVQARHRSVSRREAVRRLGLLGLGVTAGIPLVGACTQGPEYAGRDTDDPNSSGNSPIAAREIGNTGGIPWPPGLVAMWDFQEDPKGGNAITSRMGAESVTLIARGTSTVVKDAVDPGPFGPSLVLDGATVFVKDGEIGGLDVTQNGGTQVTVINWVNDTARSHDDTGDGISFRAGSHVEGGPESARQYGSYFDDSAYLGWSHGHYSPHISAQDGPSPGYPYLRDFAASARKVFTGVGQGQWHMEAFTYNGAEIIAYIDGLADVWKAVQECQPLQPGYTLRQTVDRNPFFLGKPINNSPTMKRFSIGAAISGEPPFEGVNFTTGRLGGVAVFNRALTAEEIMAIRIRTLRPDEPITTYSFEVTSTGPQPLDDIGWSATAGLNNVDVSADVGDDYRISRPDGATKAFLRKASSTIGATWVPLTGLSSAQVKRVRFKLLSSTSSSAPQRLLVKIGDQWWASATAYSMGKPASDETDWSQASLITHAMANDKGRWRSVSLGSGVLKVDADANDKAISTGPLNSIGFISEGGDGSNARITDLELLPD